MVKMKEKKEFVSEYSFHWGKMGKFLSIVLETGKQYPFLFVGVILTTSINALIAVLLPLAASNITSLLVSGSIGQSNTNIFLGLTMHWYSWIYVCLVIFGFLIIAEYLTDYSIGIFSARVEISQRNKILIALVNQDVDFFFDKVSGNILTRLVGDTQGLALGIQQFLTNIIYCVVMFIAATSILFIKGYSTIGWIAFVYIVIVIFIGILLFVKFRRKMIEMFDVKREIDTDMTDRISNITLIKSTGTEKFELERTEDQLHIYNKKGDSVVKWSASLNVWVSATVTFVTTLITIIAAVTAINGNGVEIFSTLPLALPMVSFMGLPVIMIVPTLRAASRAANCADRIGELTDPVPTILPNIDGPKIKKIDTIEFKNLNFAYPKKKDKIILPNINFKFEKGKSYAFVGETGSGKSTIGRLLLRYYEPQSGEIIINGKYPLNKLNLPSFLGKVGYVEQDPQIFFGNFIENVRYGKFDANEKQVISACKKAKLHDFIMSLPEGYQTILGQRGFLLSGGQKQRLVIARVFLKNPDLIILDEATSALDNIVEKEIQDQLDELIKGKTSITIAHRLSTIKNVDKIIVLGMDKGIIQEGNFKELINQEGHFQRLYRAGKVK
ncbi:ABC transporter ATP-binding protein [Williamsoniiplasma somnilux]|uniref:ABC transporter ATP-binding protein n=1 Tax=Williamsoniiplasma somnilux TaxID=215578 RepID=A0A2K8NYC6_9MOLU|nr:ABC transporter ATP-binding protein [Williamsoniiplasma somnilux]ATZ18819.1 ABC transporter ATP-binding protein [Williamsoniiplasma somnilux]